MGRFRIMMGVCCRGRWVATCRNGPFAAESERIEETEVRLVSHQKWNSELSWKTIELILSPDLTWSSHCSTLST